MTHTTISELTALVLKFRDERDWKQFHNAKDMALSLLLEAGEVLELTQWKNGSELEAHIRSHRDQLADELSDVLYWVLEMAHEYEIDLGNAFKRKLEKNAKKYPIEKARSSARKYTDL